MRPIVCDMLRCCLVLLAVALARSDQQLLAGPLADAVARAKAAAGVAVDSNVEPPPAAEPVAVDPATADNKPVKVDGGSHFREDTLQFAAGANTIDPDVPAPGTGSIAFDASSTIHRVEYSNIE